MPKKDDGLDHLLLVKGPQKRMYEGKGNGGDLLLLRGVPEPLDSFADKAFAERLVEDGIAVFVTEQGKTEEGKVHPDVRAHKAAEKEAAAEAQAALASENPGAVAVVVTEDVSPVASVSSTVRTTADAPSTIAADAAPAAPAPTTKKP